MRLPRFVRRLLRRSGWNRPEAGELADQAPRPRPIQARYAAAGSSDDMAAHWALADALDADSANSLAIRKRLRERSRLEQGNNGYSCGMVRTNANYVVGRGPTLRMQTTSAGFNSMVEARWQAWCKAVLFTRKLRTGCKAKTGDGEAFLQLVTNPGVNDPVKLDVKPLECDQITTPNLRYGEPRHIDGLQFDEFGNPTVYDVLPYHPGGFWTAAMKLNDPIPVPAKFMAHWFQQDRPGQHRGVPEATSTVNLFGQGRRYREATIAGAETAADFAALLEMGATNDGPDEVRPFSTLPIEKRMLVATPAGAKLAQMKAEQPPTTYDMFNRSIVSEEARPLSMSYSIAACDSSGNSFSGTQNDHLIFYQAVDAEGRADCESLVLDKVFALWFEEAVHVYGWAIPDTPAPRHTWDWPPMPQVDAEKAGKADKAELGIGVPPSVIAARRGADYEDWVNQAATDYGVTAEEYRAKLFAVNFQKAGAAPAPGGSPKPAAASAIGASRFAPASRNGD